MNMNNNSITPEIKSRTLRAAHKAYFIRKAVKYSLLPTSAAAIILLMVIFMPESTPVPDITTETAAAKEVYVDEDVPENEFLTVFGDEMIIPELFAQYNQIKGVRKLANPYYPLIKDMSSLNEFEEVLIKDLASSNGPDIILFAGLYKSTASLAEAGYFADMDKIINSHPDFDMNDYNTDVLDSALIEGRRYYFPLYYYTKYQLSTRGKFATLGLEAPDTLDMESFFGLAEDFFAAVPQGQPMNYTHLMNDIASAVIANGEITKDAATEKYFSLIKEELKRAKTKTGVAVETSENYDYFENRINTFFDSDYLFLNGDHLSNPEKLFDILGIFENHMLRESSTDSMLIYTDMLNPDGVVKGHTYLNIAINADSKLKNEAFDFVKYIMSEEIQLKPYMVSGLAPVNSAAYLSLKQSALEKAETEGKTELLEKAIDIIESAEVFEDCLSYPKVLYENTEFQKYLEDETTFEEMADSVNRDISRLNQNGG